MAADYTSELRGAEVPATVEALRAAGAPSAVSTSLPRTTAIVAAGLVGAAAAR